MCRIRFLRYRKATSRASRTAPVIDEIVPRVAPKVNIGPGGLPLVKPPWGRIVATDLNKGDRAWTIANSDTPDYVRNHPLLKGIDLDGNDLFNGVAGGGGNIFRAINKKTGAVLHEMQLPSMATGIPMTYMVDGGSSLSSWWEQPECLPG
jgi:glucose dehydrogenase